MIKAKNRLLLLTVFLFVAVCVYTTSCKKCNCCGAFVTVIDSLDKPVSGAVVRLYGDTPEAPDETKTTDANGHADFNICNYILKISVNGTEQGYIELGSDEGTEKIIQLD